MPAGRPNVKGNAIRLLVQQQPFLSVHQIVARVGCTEARVYETLAEMRRSSDPVEQTSAILHEQYRRWSRLTGRGLKAPVQMAARRLQPVARGYGDGASRVQS